MMSTLPIVSGAHRRGFRLLPLTRRLKSERAHGSSSDGPASTCDLRSLSSSLSYNLHEGKLLCIAPAEYLDQVREIWKGTRNIDRIVPAPLSQADFLISASNCTSTSTSISIKHLSASAANTFYVQTQPSSGPNTQIHRQQTIRQIWEPCNSFPCVIRASSLLLHHHHPSLVRGNQALRHCPRRA